MIFQSIIKNISWDQIQKRLIELYPDQEINLDLYENVYLTLLNLPVVREDKKILLRIRYVKDSSESWYDIDGYVENEQLGYGLQFLKWENWLGLEISEETLNQFSEIDITCHCLWEMTYSGFTQEEIEKNYHSLNEKNDDQLETIVIDDEFKIQIPNNLDKMQKKKIIAQFTDLIKNENMKKNLFGKDQK
ncbi:MAG: DUF6557 family protein [Candidatus Thorarchaeota archaeon]